MKDEYPNNSKTVLYLWKCCTVQDILENAYWMSGTKFHKKKNKVSVSCASKEK